MILGGNWNNGSNSGSRSANWNNAPSNSNNNIGGRGACDSDMGLHAPLRETGWADHWWSAAFCSFGKYIERSARRGSTASPETPRQRLQAVA